ncbi:MAG: hypothetical protein ACE5GB_06000 [Acidimicrobiales bacterium]
MSVDGLAPPRLDRPAIPRPSERRGRTLDRTDLRWSGPVGAVALVFAAGSHVAAAAAGPASAAGLVVLGLVVVVALPWTARVGRSVPGADLAGLLRLSLGLKLLATLPRFDSRVDAQVYHRMGATLADSFRSLDFTVETGRSIPGTGSVRYFTGLVEVLTLEDEFATFLVFSMIGFVGIVWFVQAFSIALPALPIRRYALLVLLWPSLLYWPSSIGKESMMLFGLGACARGLAQVLRHRRTGIVWLGVGLAVAVLVRPHVGLIVVTAAVSALIMRRPVGRAMGVTRLVVVGALVFAGSLAVDAVERLLDIDGLSPTGVTAALDLAELRSAQGGSVFESARIDSILDYPWGLVTVLVRPFPHEAVSAAMVLTAVEGAVLGGLMIAAVPRIVAQAGRLREEAYTIYAVVFMIVFVYLFSAIANFGILARQRTTVIPLVLVLVALPTRRERVRRRRVGSRP